jgi:hypothetical protein
MEMVVKGFVDVVQQHEPFQLRQQPHQVAGQRILLGLKSFGMPWCVLSDLRERWLGDEGKPAQYLVQNGILSLVSTALHQLVGPVSRDE